MQKNRHARSRLSLAQRPARLFLLAVLAGVSACSTVPNAGDNRSSGNEAGAARSGVEAFGTIDAGVSRQRTR